MFNDDTIVAISTPYGEAGIGIIRLSGKESFDIAQRIFKPSSKSKINSFKDHTINYGWIVNPDNKEIIDEVFITILKAPRTYTRENMIEINCHGGWVPINNVINVVLRLGARIANPGEFTLRAFLNGRIDLTKAEAVLNIIRAKNNTALRGAINNLRGDFKRELDRLNDLIYEINELINLELDFQINIKDSNKILKEKLKESINFAKKILNNCETDEKINNGINIALCGKPNVGKSSLLNRLCNHDHVITSKIPGTTRDCIKVDLNLEGVFYKLFDTAGIRKPKGDLEAISIKKSKDEILNCTIIILIIDISRVLTELDLEIFNWLKKLKKKIIIVCNKIDLKRKIKKQELCSCFNGHKFIEISAKDGSGIDILKNLVMRESKDILNKFGLKMLINFRQKKLLEKALDNLEKANKILYNNLQKDMLSEELNMASNNIDNITGKIFDESSINKLFENFCIGK